MNKAGIYFHENVYAIEEMPKTQKRKNVNGSQNSEANTLKYLGIIWKWPVMEFSFESINNKFNFRWQRKPRRILREIPIGN